MNALTLRMRAAIVVLCAALALMAMPVPALADGGEQEGDLSELQIKIEESGKAYDEACAKVESLNEEAAQNQARIDEVSAQLPAQRQKASAAIAASYKMSQNQPGLMGLILSSENFDDFLATITYLNAVQGHNLDQVDRLNDLQDELESNQAELAQRQAEAEAQKQAAQTALDEAKAAREEAQRQAEEQAAREAAEAAAALQAEADAQAAAQAAPVSQAAVPSAPSSVDWSSDKSSFVAQWAPRIDAYLAGSPLAGQGTTFASAAWDYGVDPRWSPAISNTESSKAAVCFRPYNAWGWGNASWSSWEEAIPAHVAGLARGYGFTISYSYAMRYCPPNYDNWYRDTLGQMQQI